MPHLYPLQNEEKNRLALLPKSFKPPVPLKKHERNWKFPWFSKIPPKKRVTLTSTRTEAATEKIFMRKIPQKRSIAGVGEVASVFYTVLLGTLLKSEGFNGREQRNHPATSVVLLRFFGGRFLQQFWRGKYEYTTYCREFLPFWFEPYAISVY